MALPSGGRTAGSNGVEDAESAVAASTRATPGETGAASGELFFSETFPSFFLSRYELPAPTPEPGGVGAIAVSLSGGPSLRASRNEPPFVFRRFLDGALVAIISASGRVASRVAAAATRATGTLSGRPGGPAGFALGTRTHSNGQCAAPTNTSLFTFPAASVTVGYIELAAATQRPSTMNLNAYVPVGKMATAECVGPVFFESFESSSFVVLLVASVCVHPPATSPAICTSSPPPYQLIVTWCSFTSEEDAASVSEAAEKSFFSFRKTHRGARCASMASVRRANLAGSSDAAKSASLDPEPLYTWKYGSFATPSLRHRSLHASKSILQNSTSCSLSASRRRRGYRRRHELHHLP